MQAWWFVAIAPGNGAVVARIGNTATMPRVAHPRLKRHTRVKIAETLYLAESCGINTLLTNPMLCGVITDYWRQGPWAKKRRLYHVRPSPLSDLAGRSARAD
jgi:hypothetical protein